MKQPNPGGAGANSREKKIKKNTNKIKTNEKKNALLRAFLFSKSNTRI